MGHGGALVVVLTVDGIFVLFATKGTRSALVERDYDTGDRKSGEELVKELKEQHALSWQTEIKKPNSIVMGVPTAYEIAVKDREGQPVSGALGVAAYRPSDASKDFTTAFKEVASGRYQGYINFPLKGYWELHIRIKRGEERFSVDTEKFMVVAP